MKVRRKISPTVNARFSDFSSVVLNDWVQPLVVEQRYILKALLHCLSVSDA
jgi:hypothetical protein